MEREVALRMQGTTSGNPNTFQASALHQQQQLPSYLSHPPLAPPQLAFGVQLPFASAQPPPFPAMNNALPPIQNQFFPQATLTPTSQLYSSTYQPSQLDALKASSFAALTSANTSAYDRYMQSTLAAQQSRDSFATMSATINNNTEAWKMLYGPK